VVLHRVVDELLEFGELENLVEQAIRFATRQAEQGCVEVDILPARELRVESRSELEQRRDPTFGHDLARTRPKNSCEHLQGRGLAGPVGSDQADGAAALDVQRKVMQRIEGMARGATANQALFQTCRALGVNNELLADIASTDHDVGHRYSSSAKSA